VLKELMSLLLLLACTVYVLLGRTEEAVTLGVALLLSRPRPGPQIR
jgi:hypothetical protein